MSDFLPSTPELDALLAQCRDPEEIREVSKRYMERKGLIRRGYDYGQGEEVINQPERFAPLSASPSSLPKCIRVIYPHVNDRYEICGESEEELDEKEARIRAMYGNRR
jgi:hypothetical protein